MGCEKGRLFVFELCLGNWVIVGRGGKKFMEEDLVFLVIFVGWLKSVFLVFLGGFFLRLELEEEKELDKL